MAMAFQFKFSCSIQRRSIMHYTIKYPTRYLLHGLLQQLSTVVVTLFDAIWGLDRSEDWACVSLAPGA